VYRFYHGLDPGGRTLASMATPAAPGTAAIAFATAQGTVCDVLRADSTGTVHDDTLYTSYVRPVPDLFGPCPATPDGVSHRQPHPRPCTASAPVPTLPSRPPAPTPAPRAAPSICAASQLPI
jgi:hypothetical protein